MRSKAALNKLIESKSKEMTDLAKEIEDLKYELSTLEKLDIQDKLFKRVAQFEDLIKSLVEHIEDFNSKRLSTIFELTIDEDYISIVDVKSGKKVANLALMLSNDLGIQEWLKDQFDLINFYHDVVSGYRKYLVDSTRNRVTLKFNDALTFHLVKYGSDVEINVQRRLTKRDVVDELITRSRTPYEDRKYESDFWEIDGDDFILLEEATFDRPAATVDREIEDILKLFS